MFRQYVIPTAFAVALAGAGVSAQQTQQPPTQQPPTQQQQPPQHAGEHAENRTLEGCVYREADIPGRSPNVAERAGIGEDYILVASVTAAAAGTVGTSGTTGAAGATAAAMPKVFKLEHEDGDKLKNMVGKRVKVTGKADVDAGDRTATGAPARDTNPMSPDQIELPEFEVTTIAEATGGEACPATPEIRRENR
jgi:hypothetical protein